MTADKGDMTGCTVSLIALRGLSAFPTRRAIQASEAPEPFAMIGPALVKSNYHEYPPFYSNVIAPHAVLAKGRVVCAFQDTDGRPVVMMYDIQAKAWEGPVHASQFGLGKDAHGNPSVCIDQKGYIHIFHGCHGGPMKHTANMRPYDLTSGEERSSPTSRATYPQSIRFADGDLFLFYRAGGHMEPWSARISEDDGETWFEAEKVIEMRIDPPDRLAAAYASICPGVEGKTVHCFWVHKDDNAARVTKGTPHPWRPLKYPGLHEAVYRYNMYYVSRDAEGTWRNATGQKVTLPVRKAYADKHCWSTTPATSSPASAFRSSTSRTGLMFGSGPASATGKRGGKVIKPWHNLYANHVGGKWRVHEALPTDWPTKMKRFAAAPGSAAFSPRTQVPWFMYLRQRQVQSQELQLDVPLPPRPRLRHPLRRPSQTPVDGWRMHTSRWDALRCWKGVFGRRHVGDETEDLTGGHVGFAGRALLGGHVADEALGRLVGSLLLLALAQQIEQGSGPDVDRLGDFGLGQLVLIVVDALPGFFHLRQGEVPDFSRFGIHMAAAFITTSKGKTSRI